MINQTISTAFILLLILFTSSCSLQNDQAFSSEELSWLQNQSNKLEVLFGYEAPPNAFHDKNGEYVGFLVDYLREIEQQLGINFKFRNFDTWNELIEYSKSGRNFIVVGIAYTDARANYLLFTSSFINIPYVIVTRYDSHLTTMNSLRDSQVCTVSSYAVNDYIKDYYPSLKPKGVKDNLQGLRRVSTGECDAMIINQMYASYLISSQGLTNLKIAGESGYFNPLSAATSIHDPDLANMLTRAISLIKSGRQQKLYQKWVSAGSAGIPGSVVISITVFATLIIFLLISFWFWTISLKKQVRKQTHAIQKAKEQFEKAIKRAPIPMVIADSNQDIRLFNQKFIDEFGYTLEDISSAEQWWQTLYPDEKYRTEVQNAWLNAIDVTNNKVSEINVQEWDISIKDGTTRKVEFKMTVLGDISLIAMNDITEQKHTEEELRKLSRAVEQSSSAVVITDNNGSIEYVNPKFGEITGYSKAEVLGKNPRILKSGETPESVYAELWETITRGEEWKGKFRNKRKDGRFYWAQDSISGVRDEHGTLTHFIAIQDDITHEYELTEQLSYQATHDLLTGLINRREFERRTERVLLISPQDRDEHALCFLDLDQFKVINDTCGHMAGDELLRQLGRLLANVVRKRDSLARLGGDEFGVLMEHCSLDQAVRVANDLLKSIQDFQFSWEGQSFRIGVSIGLVAITEAIPNITELLKQADAACYMAKDLGRNRIHVYHPEDIELAQRQGEMQWVTRINQALEEDRFCLYAQPITPLDNSQRKHYELLIRMVGEDDKIIPPGAFLTAAERYNFIEILDAWVIKKAFASLAAFPKFLEDIEFISINLSGPSLTNSGFLEYISSQFRESGIEANKICFEVTETVAISNLNAAITFISVLKESGCQFSLDDFGSGLSSFGYLKNLPVDYLKIDGMFVKDIVDDPIDRAMVKSINDIGHVMGMKTVAEFVENDEIIGMLKIIGVDYAQGYGLGKPESFDELLERYKSR